MTTDGFGLSKGAIKTPPQQNPAAVTAAAPQEGDPLSPGQMLKKIQEKNPSFSLDSLILRGYVEDTRSSGPVTVVFRSLSTEEIIDADIETEIATDQRISIQTAFSLKTIAYVCRSIQSLSFSGSKRKVSESQDPKIRIAENRKLIYSLGFEVTNVILSLYQKFAADVRLLTTAEAFESFSKAPSA